MKLMFTKMLIASILISCSGEATKQDEPAKHGKAEPKAEAKAGGLATSDPAIQQIDKFINDKDIDLKADPATKTKMPKPPELEFAADKNYFWHIDTSLGEIKIRLMPDVAPMHVSSTIYLTRTGYYDKLGFHRIINQPPFMAQGGCPFGTGTGSPGYEYSGEFSAEVKHDRPGLLSMANSGPGTDGSQFFLTFAPTPWLDGKHTIFGEIVEGMEVLKEIQSYGSQSGRPTKKITMDKNWISVAKKSDANPQGQQQEASSR